ncbi:hypothetical protein GIB67_038432 [Kingdonia uniflora]|uniref:Transcription initiation factor TFIID subunit 2 n=1 Tax=Kingdonia uniflora TaxID=39325 RepID=A0A7J7NP19_9MAGN|nr:hypothetical protein GIB67_038432 [Kingdonia uniflora]
MAKPRKQQKNDDPKSDSSEAIVQHQKLCLSIDMENARIYGYTELRIAVPESGLIELHADNMTIEGVTVDGETTEYQSFPHYQFVDDARRWSSVSSTSAASDAACSTYVSLLDKEMRPNLKILCGKLAKKSVEEGEGDGGNKEGDGGSSSQSVDDFKQNVKLVRIDYWIGKAETGIHFGNNVLHTDNQLRRTCCWFPCMDNSLQRCCYDLEFTVEQNLVAVSNGTLLYQVLSKDDPPRITYVYRLNVPVTAEWISLAVAPLEILPDRHIGLLSHMCMSPSFSMLRNTVGFFHNAYSHYEDYLSAPFPFGSYKQVFIVPEMTISSVSLGASMGIFSSQLLFDEKVIDQTIGTRIKLAHALARQWFGVYITAETSSDEWLLDGLAGFLTDSFTKRFLGNNEARYLRYKANSEVCMADVSDATALNSADVYGTQCMGLYGKVRSWKSVAILQMLEKQMGPETFRKILQIIILKAQDTTRSMRTLSTKEFRHFANKVGNLERPFLKEFFPRWVGSCGCPVLSMGLSYNKRKNMLELAIFRGCTAKSDSILSTPKSKPDSETRETDIGWPGMMSIRVHELDGMYDHPILPMAGEAWQLLEIQCHAKLAAARRIQKPKKGSRPDGSDDNADAPTADMRPNAESPLLWIRADPEMEYLAEVHLNQPIQMWINQLEKDKDVIAQAQAISTLEALPQLPFAVVNALYNFLNDSKAFWRVRVEAAFALSNTASEETDWAGLQHLIKFYKSRRFDTSVGLPRPNDFHDFPEYFVLEVIPRAIAMVRAADDKSPREAVEFVLQLLKYNDNNGNSFSDVYWLAALVQSIGELEFGQQSIHLLSSLLKRIDRLLQFDRLMPSYSGILTITCIRTLTQMALKLSTSIPLERVFELFRPFRKSGTLWQVRIEASKALLDVEFHCRGIDATLLLFITYLEEEVSLRGQVKLSVHALRLCQMRGGSEYKDDVNGPTLVALLRLLESRTAFNNVCLRHNLFCILQILAGRPPTLNGVPRIHVQPIGDIETHVQSIKATETCSEENIDKSSSVMKLKIAGPETLVPNAIDLLPVANPVLEVPKEILDTVSNGSERRMPVVKIRVKQSAASSRADDSDRIFIDLEDTEPRRASSSMSVDAPMRQTIDPLGTNNNENIEEISSSHDHCSRVAASIGSTKLAKSEDEVRKELQCTADSRNRDGNNGEANIKQKYMSLQTLSVERRKQDGPPLGMEDLNSREKKKEKKRKDKDKKRKRDENREDPEYLERKRLKKEKRQKEKETGKSQIENTKETNVDPQGTKEESKIKTAIVVLKSNEPSGSKRAIKTVETNGEPSEGSSVPKLRFKIINRNLNKS